MSNTIHFSNSYKMSASRQVFESITVNRARELILAAVPQPTATITLPLAQSVGFVAACDIAAANPLPTYTNSAMDGYAFRYEDISDVTEVVLPVVGQSFAGAPCPALTFAHATCIEIATGAALPEALDTVIPFEKCDIDAKARTIRFSVDSVKHGANVRYEGEQIGRGEVIVQTGTLLRPQHLALLAAAGISEITVHSRLRVALLTTGSELAEPGQPLGRYQTYNSNGVMLETMLKSMNCSVEAVSMQDNADIIAQKISELLTRNDMLILTGGAGNGKFDISQTQLNAMGSMHPWSINMRPGRPMRFGQIQGKPVFVLPGNPVAAFVTFLEFVRGALLQMQGLKKDLWLKQYPARLANNLKKKAGRAEFMRGRLVNFDNGTPVVEPLLNQSSADLVMLSQSEVILCLDHESTQYEKGSIVPIQYLRDADL